MKILVMNCGSSSVKYQLIDMEGEQVMAMGLVERIGIEGSKIKHDIIGKDRVVVEKPMENHKKAIKLVLNIIADKEYGAISSMDEIIAVGHRVVHGGENFSSSIIINQRVLDELIANIELAPLDNPSNIMGINACKEIMPNIPMVAVFDTAFHQTMPIENYIYPIPYKYYKKYKIRRYGFHGISHKYVSLKAAELLNKDIQDLNIVTCHLGNGSSMAAIKGGKSIDTSMGFTPLGGSVMGTRSGNIDPSIITYLMHMEDITFDEVDDILNKESGVLGISGLSSDFRDLQNAAKEGHERAKLAIKIFTNRVREYVSAYAAQMGRIDVLIFTGGIGENSSLARKMICDGLECLNIKIDDSINNNTNGREVVLSKDLTGVTVMIIPTNEELMIARETLELVRES